MVTTQQSRWSQFLVLFGTVAVSLFLTPKFSSEPVDLPKLFILVLFAGPLAGVILTRSSFFAEKQNRIFLGIISGILIQLTLILLISGAPFNQQFFGAFGRNTGFLAYLALIIFLISSALVSNEKFVRNLSFCLLITGLGSAFYGFLQLTKHDPIKWNNPYNPMIAFLGNPDFASAFLGISSATGVALIFTTKVKPSTKSLVALGELFCLFIAIKSHAQQGVLVFGISGTIILYIFLTKNDNFGKIWSRMFAAGSFAAGIVVAFGIFKVGPLAETLYKVSVRQRGFYWHAAIEMAKSHPFLGVGLDSFGDNYLKYRSKNAALYSMQTQSNAAHNVYLDLLSNGGFILFFLYVALTIYVAFCGIKVVRTMKEFDPYFIGIFVAWVGYQAQSIVSINQLGIAIWGWVLSGAIIGYRWKSRDLAPATRKKTQKRTASTDFILPILGFIFGISLALPPFLADHNYWLAATSRDANKVISSAKAYPEDLGRTIGIAQTLANSKLIPQALELAEHVVSVSPKSYNGWVLISKLTPVGSDKYNQAIRQMKLQNPQDPSIK